MLICPFFWENLQREDPCS